jgi:hypothetical protein
VLLRLCFRLVIKLEEVSPWKIKPLKMAWLAWLVSSGETKCRKMPPKPVPPLIQAAMKGDSTAVRVILSQAKQEYNPNETNPNKKGLNTALHEACWRNHASCVRALLEDERVDRNCQNRRGYTGLVLAALKGHDETVDVLLSDSQVKRSPPDKIALETENADVLTLRSIQTVKRRRRARFRGIVRCIIQLLRVRDRISERLYGDIDASDDEFKDDMGDGGTRSKYNGRSRNLPIAHGSGLVGNIAGFVSACVKPNRPRLIAISSSRPSLCKRCAHDPCECKYRKQGTTYEAAMMTKAIANERNSEKGSKSTQGSTSYFAPV